MLARRFVTVVFTFSVAGSIAACGGAQATAHDPPLRDRARG